MSSFDTKDIVLVLITANRVGNCLLNLEARYLSFHNRQRLRYFDHISFDHHCVTGRFGALLSEKNLSYTNNSSSDFECC